MGRDRLRPLRAGIDALVVPQAVAFFFEPLQNRIDDRRIPVTLADKDKILFPFIGNHRTSIHLQIPLNMVRKYHEFLQNNIIICFRICKAFEDDLLSDFHP